MPTVGGCDNTHANSGSAVVVHGAVFESVNRKVKSKYGYQLRIINMIHAVPGRMTGHRNDWAVVITLDPMRSRRRSHSGRRQLYLASSARRSAPGETP